MNTTQTAAERVREIVEAKPIVLAELDDAALATHLNDLQEEHRATLAQILHEYINPLKACNEPQIAAAKEELERRIKAAREKNPTARALAIPGFRCELVPEYGEAMKDLEAAREAQKLLPPAEAAKLIKHVPEVIIEAHDEIGNAQSILALKRKYPVDSEVGKLLERAYNKPKIGERLVFEPGDGEGAQPALNGGAA